MVWGGANPRTNVSGTMFDAEFDFKVSMSASPRKSRKHCPKVNLCYNKFPKKKFGCRKMAALHYQLLSNGKPYRQLAINDSDKSPVASQET